MLSNKEMSEEKTPVNIKDADKFHEKIKRLGSFPKGERPQAYQEYYLNGQWHNAERQIVNRSTVLQFTPKAGETVIELGCQTGGFLQHAYLCGVRTLLGIDYDKDYIQLAKEMNTRNAMNIDFQVGDITKEALWTQIKQKYPVIHHLLLLSLGKHIGENKLLSIIDKLQAKRTYIETNAYFGPVEKAPYYKAISARGGRLIGKTNDRNVRLVYLIEK